VTQPIAARWPRNTTTEAQQLRAQLFEAREPEIRAPEQAHQPGSTAREDPMTAAIAELVARETERTALTNRTPVKPPKFDPEKRYVTKGIPQKRAFESELKYHFLENQWYYSGPEADKRKILTAVRAFGEEMRTRWNQEVDDGADLDNMTWEDFDDFLVRQINSPELLRDNADRAYASLKQRDNQSVAQFNVVLRSYESMASVEYNDEQRKVHLRARILDSIRLKSNGWQKPTNPSYDAYVTWLQAVEDSMPERQQAIRGARNEGNNNNHHHRPANQEHGAGARGGPARRGGRGRGRGNPRNQPYDRESQQRGGNSNDITCGHCGRRGHTEAQCWTLHPELRPNRNNNKDRSTE